jgi:hypothetical protein
VGSVAGGGGSGGCRSNQNRAGGNGGDGRVRLTWDPVMFNNYKFVRSVSAGVISVTEKIR